METLSTQKMSMKKSYPEKLKYAKLILQENFIDHEQIDFFFPLFLK